MSSEYLIMATVVAPPETYQAIVDAVANRGDANPEGSGGDEHEVCVRNPIWAKNRPRELRLLSLREIGLLDGIHGRWDKSEHESFELVVARQTRDRILRASPAATVEQVTVVNIDRAKPQASIDEGGTVRVNGQIVVEEVRLADGEVQPPSRRSATARTLPFGEITGPAADPRAGHGTNSDVAEGE